MGQKNSSLLCDISNSIATSQVEKSYYNQIFLQNKKNKQKFMEELQSIKKRLAELQYEWIQELINLLKKKNSE